MKPPRELDAMVDAALAYNTNRKRELHVPEVTPSKNWSIPIDRVFSHGDQRFDASFFDPKVDADVSTLDGHATKRLDELATLILPGRFDEYGPSTKSTGSPTSTPPTNPVFPRSAGGSSLPLAGLEHRIDALIIRKDWLLMTCSGTIGRVFHVPAQPTDGPRRMTSSASCPTLPISPDTCTHGAARRSHRHKSAATHTAGRSTTSPMIR